MKIEKLSDTQIRCTLTGNDMLSRNLSISELTYGSEKARNLFHEMIMQASQDFGFDAEDAPLMVEAVPLSPDSIMLLITRMDDPEELDTRFSTFSPEPEDQNFPDLSSELLDGAENLARLFSQAMQSAMTDPESTQTEEEDSVPSSSAEISEAESPAGKLFCFDSLDRVSDASRAVGTSYDGRNTLYKNPRDKHFYLILTGENTDELSFSRASNILSEFASRMSFEYASENYFEEHYEVICRDKALQVFRSL